MASDMTAALSADGGGTLDAIEKEFQETQARVKSNLDLLPKNNGTRALKEAALKLLALGEGKASVFKVRQKELDANDYGPDRSRRDPQAQCRPRRQRQATGGRRANRHRCRDLAGATKDFAASIIMLALGGLTLVGSGLFVWLYVGRNILRRIRNLQRSMQLSLRWRPGDGNLIAAGRVTRSR